jgi:peptidoglycan/xylan/chitin deacetylase (PgdA/CDA1 family)
VHLPPGVPRAATAPLGDERIESLTKGYDAALEQRVARELLDRGLSARVLRVAVAVGPSGPLVLVKLQAGDARTGDMTLAGLHTDILVTCETVFGVLPAAASVDVWAVTPSLNGDDVHAVVFSASVRRKAWEETAGAPPVERLAAFGAVRYAPGFLQYCPETLTVGGLREHLPRTAFTSWPRSRSAARLTREARGHVRAHALAAERQVPACVSADASAGAVCLTFDDGPHPLITPWVLDILRQHEAKATFFIVGSQVEHYPELLSRIIEDGHELANHSYSHQRLADLDPSWVWAELRATEEAVERIVPARMRFFRPPGGRCTADTLRVASSMGYVTALWTHNTGDWRKPAPDEIVRAATRNAAAGAIIMMHQDDAPSCLALPAILEHYAGMGLSFKTLSEGVGRSGIRELRPEALLARLGGSDL